MPTGPSRPAPSRATGPAAGRRCPRRFRAGRRGGSGGDGAPRSRAGGDEPTASRAAGPAARAGPADGLTEREQRILAFEQQWWKHAGAKEQAIRDTFGLSATRYYQLLNALLDHPAALAAEPVLIGRLRRLRSSRARNRRR